MPAGPVRTHARRRHLGLQGDPEIAVESAALLMVEDALRGGCLVDGVEPAVWAASGRSLRQVRDGASGSDESAGVTDRVP